MDQLIKIPEFILFDVINKALAYLRADYASQTDKANSFLAKVLYGNALERYDLTTQAKKVFVDNDLTNQRFLEAHLMFNMDRAKLPTIHLCLPSEQTQSGGNGLGTDEGYMSDEFVDSTYNTDGTVRVAGSNTPVFTRRFQSTYNIVITSDNSNEVILIYHTLRALLIALIPSIALSGLENITLGGGDLGLRDVNFYSRVISVNLQYETAAPSIFPNPIAHNLIAHGTPINE